MEESSKIIEQPQQNENIIPNSRYQNLYEEENSIEPHHMVSQSWNFTPKQNFYLNYIKSHDDFIPTDINNPFPFSYRKAEYVEDKYKKAKLPFKNFHPEKYCTLTGDYRRNRSPAYSFGIRKHLNKANINNSLVPSYDENDIKPIIKESNSFNGKLSNVYPLISLKNKKNFENFVNLHEDRFKGGNLNNIGSKDIFPGPGAYNVDKITMFSGHGRVPLSNFRNNNPITIGRRYDRVNYDVNPGPGYYNHCTNFGRIYY